MVQSWILEGNINIITLNYILLVQSRILIWKIIPQKNKTSERFPPSTVSKNTMKKIGHHARKRENMGKSIYA